MMRPSPGCLPHPASVSAEAGGGACTSASQDTRRLPMEEAVSLMVSAAGHCRRSSKGGTEGLRKKGLYMPDRLNQRRKWHPDLSDVSAYGTN